MCGRRFGAGIDGIVGLPDHLRCGNAQPPCRVRIHPGEAPVAVERVVAVADAVDDGAVPRVAVLQLLLDGLEIVDVRRHPEASDDMPVGVAQRARAADEPAIEAVGGAQPQLVDRHVRRRLAEHRGRHRQVLGMDHLEPAGAEPAAGRQAGIVVEAGVDEQALAVAAGDIEDVRHRVGHGPEALLALAQRLLGAPALGDVDGAADIAEELAVGGEAWRARIVHPTVFAVGAPQPVFHPERVAPVEMRHVGFQAARKVVGVHAVAPTVALLLLAGAAGEVEPGLVEVGAAPIGPGLPDQRRDIVEHGAEAVVAGAQRLDRAALVGDVARLADHVRDAAVVAAREDGSAARQPAIRAVGVEHAVLDRRDLAVAEIFEAAEMRFDQRQVVGMRQPGGQIAAEPGQLLRRESQQIVHTPIDIDMAPQADVVDIEDVRRRLGDLLEQAARPAAVECYPLANWRLRRLEKRNVWHPHRSRRCVAPARNPCCVA